MDLLCTVSIVGDTTVVALSGAVDMSSVPTLRSTLVRAVSDHPGETLVIDLDGVTVLDDTGLGVILGTAGLARESDGDVALVASSESILRRLAITGTDRAVTVRARVARPVAG